MDAQLASWGSQRKWERKITGNPRIGATLWGGFWAEGNFVEVNSKPYITQSLEGPRRAISKWTQEIQWLLDRIEPFYSEQYNASRRRPLKCPIDY